VKRVIPPKLAKQNGASLNTKFGQDSAPVEDPFSSMTVLLDATDKADKPQDEWKDEGMRSGVLNGQGVLNEEGVMSGGNNGTESASMTRWEQSGEWISRWTASNDSNKLYAKLKADFTSEMRHLSKLRHPCVTMVLGAVISKVEEPMLVMEYMDHGSLYDLLHNTTVPIQGELLLPILRDIAQGMRFLHAASPQVIHGDLKAQNVLVDSKFRAKVADFGLSQKRQVGATGTPFWMAPELLRKESCNTAASDVYSFGIILYEVYSRKDPYEGEDWKEVLRLVADPVVNKRPPPPESAPPLVRTLMAEVLSGKPEARPTFEVLDQKLKGSDVDTVEPMWKVDSRTSINEGPNGIGRSSSALLREVFPKHVAEALREGRKVEPESREVVTIFFSDIVGFTDISSSLPPLKVAKMLDSLYNRFDELSGKHDVFKVETIGDAYMAVTNLVKDQADHTKRIAQFAIEAVAAANETLIDQDDPEKGCVHIRVGFHSGPVVANVVGTRNPRYCLFGDTVNTASRMESTSAVDRIHCSERAAAFLQQQMPLALINPRGKIQVKGKGEMRTYWINERRESGALAGDTPMEYRLASQEPDNAVVVDICTSAVRPACRSVP